MNGKYKRRSWGVVAVVLSTLNNSMTGDRLAKAPLQGEGETLAAQQRGGFRNKFRHLIVEVNKTFCIYILSSVRSFLVEAIEVILIS